jgi:D-hydroxyproline dehydrogenase subunit beta
MLEAPTGHVCKEGHKTEKISSTPPIEQANWPSLSNAMGSGSDVVVIGGGIVGCATAYELSRHGAKVVLVERDELAAGASGRNHGLLVAPLDPVLVPMADATLSFYRLFVPSAPLNVSMDRDPIGYLIVAADDAEERKAGQLEADAAASCGVTVERLTREEVFRLEPSIAPQAVAEGWLLEDVRRVQPAPLTVSLALAATAAGATIRHHLSVRQLIVEREQVRGVRTDEGEIGADHVVVATGPWSAPLLRPAGFDLPVMAGRGWLVGLAPDSLPFARILGRAGWHSPPDPEGLPPPRAADVLEAPPPAAIGTLLQPNADGTVLVGGSRQLALTSEPEDPQVPHRLLQGAVRLVPALAEARVLSAWWGLRPMTPDGRPLVGKLADGLFVATGHGSLGVTLAGGTARLIAASISGQSGPFDPAPYDPARFENPNVKPLEREDPRFRPTR